MRIHSALARRLLNEGGMQHHPLTPMYDSDLCRILARQVKLPVGHIQIATVSASAANIKHEFHSDIKMYIVDAIHSEDLHAIAAACDERKLLCGGSGIAG